LGYGEDNRGNDESGDHQDGSAFTYEVPKDKPYGALKGGAKPSYREYFNKTLKRHIHMQQSHANDGISNSKNNKKKSSKPKHVARKIKQVKRKTTVKKYKLGKYGKKISILIKNNKTIKKIQNAQRELKNVPIHDVKNELIKNNLLKLGSTAPSNLLRKIYEDANMTGKVVNVGGDTFMHNYMNGDKKKYEI
jgi:hypothetical protein